MKVYLFTLGDGNMCCHMMDCYIMCRNKLGCENRLYVHVTSVMHNHPKNRHGRDMHRANYFLVINGHAV